MLMIIAMHKADRLNLAVSAASIIAKVIRDKKYRIFKSNFTIYGSGYPLIKKLCIS